MDAADLKPIVEVAYLNQENSWRYRAIVRYCFKRHEQMHNYVYPEEIYQYLQQDASFAAYTLDQLQQDLKQLTEWKNLLARQETGRVQTIDDFKKKKFRYQCSPYTVVIERMVAELRKVGQKFGGSLEATLFERLLKALESFVGAGEAVDLPELNQRWKELEQYFRDMIQSASDYLAHLKSDKIEERMMTESFILYKNSFTEYLQNFILGMQRSSYKIEALLRKTPPETIERLTERLAAYQMRIPRLEDPWNPEELAAEYRAQFWSLRDWFLGRGAHPSELLTLQNETTETIRRIARFAQRIAEQHQSFRSRKHDYLHLARWFQSCADVREAHRLSSLLFGVAHTRHLYALARASDDMDARVEDETPTLVTLQPRVATFREKTKTGAIVDRSEEKRAAFEAYIAARRAHDRMMAALIVDGAIAMDALPEISPEVRKTLLYWITRCMQQKERRIQTESGWSVALEDDRPKGVATILSADGAMSLPSYRLRVTGAGG